MKSRFEHHLPQFRERDDQEKYARNQNDPHRGLPDHRISRLSAGDGGAGSHDAEHDEEIRPHARCESDRIVRQNSHQNRSEGGGDAGCRDERPERHPRRGARHLPGEERGLDADDVRHRRERGKSGDRFRSEGAAEGGVAKIAVEDGVHILCSEC